MLQDVIPRDLEPELHDRVSTAGGGDRQRGRDMHGHRDRHRTTYTQP